MKIIPSLLIDTMHGSFSGSVIRRSRWGLIGQKKANPPKRGNTNQSISRSRFQAIAGSWRSVSTPDKNDWNTIASNNPIYTKDNGLMNVTGFNFYNYIAQNLALIGQSMILPSQWNPVMPALDNFILQSPASSMLRASVENLGDSTDSFLWGGLVVLPYQGAPIFNNGLLFAKAVAPAFDIYNNDFTGLNQDFIDDFRYAFIGKVIYKTGGVSPWLFIRQS